MRLVPNRIFDKISDITPEFLQSEGVKGLVLDIDNTMAPRSVKLPDDTLKRWIKTLALAGIKLYVVSNNKENRVSKFAQALGLQYISRSMKPFPQSFRRAAREMKLNPDCIAAVGDQIYTDVFGAHSAGMRAWLVTPLSPPKNIIYRIRRRLEKPFIDRYNNDNGSSGQ